MDDFNSHGMDCIEAYINNREVPPVRYVELIQLEVQRISKIHNIDYSRALEYLIRSIINCCQGKFKKDVRLWMLKQYQSQRPILQLSDYEKELATEVHNQRDTVDINSYLNKNGEMRYGSLDRTKFPSIPSQPESPTTFPPVEIVVPQCPTHKKDCRLWLHKTSDLNRRAAVANKICQWYKDNVGLATRLSANSVPGRGEVYPTNGGTGDGNFQVVEPTKTVRRQRLHSHVGFKNNTRYGLHNGWHSNSSSDSETSLSRRRQDSPDRQVCRANNFTCPPQIYSPGSDPDIETLQQPPHKMRRGPENDNTNASKTVSDIKHAGPTPSNSSICTQISAQYENIAAADEVIARQMLEAQVGGRPLSQTDFIKRSQSYFPVYRSQSWNSGENLATEPLRDFNLNSNLRGRTSSVCSLDGSCSE